MSALSYHFTTMGYDNTRGFSEPEWLPSPEEVTRARARLERGGALRGLRDAGYTPSIAPGDTPWLWWGGAALWLLIWPAIIAARVGGRWPTLPWWALIAGPLLHIMLLAWPVLLAYLHGRPSAVRRRFAAVQTLAQMLALEPGEFEDWTALLFQLQGYGVRNTRDSGDHGIDLEVWNQQVGLGLVQCKRYRGTVGEPTVRDLYGTMANAGAQRGWLVTTGAVSRQAREWAAGKPIELWDGQALAALARRLA